MGRGGNAKAQEARSNNSDNNKTVRQQLIDFLLDSNNYYDN